MKRGVATEVILTIGILLAAGLTLLQVKTVFITQQSLGEKEVVKEFAKDLENIIDKAIASTGDVAFIYIPPIKNYKVEIKENVVRIYDKISGNEASFVKSQPEIVRSVFEDSENITIIKKGGKIYVLGRCLKEGEKCLSSLSCCKENPYCWGEEDNFICRKECAPNGEYAADADACCSGYLNETSGKCEELPVCPKDRICNGAPESEKDSLGRDCCPIDKPVCTSGHCCPLDKPKWCNNPKEGKARCMDERDYSVNCIKPKFKLIFVPVNYDPNDPDFLNRVEIYKNNLFAETKLGNPECRDSIEIIVVDKELRLGKCDARSIVRFAEDWYISHYGEALPECEHIGGVRVCMYRVIGIDKSPQVPSRCGCAHVPDIYASVAWVGGGCGRDPITLTHELAHTFGTCDEYSGCVWEKENKHHPLGCPNPKACTCCRGPYACCYGRKLNGGYCIMGPVNAPPPRHFCNYCEVAIDDYISNYLKIC